METSQGHLCVVAVVIGGEETLRGCHKAVLGVKYHDSRRQVPKNGNFTIQMWMIPVC